MRLFITESSKKVKIEQESDSGKHFLYILTIYNQYYITTVLVAAAAKDKNFISIRKLLYYVG